MAAKNVDEAAKDDVDAGGEEAWGLAMSAGELALRLCWILPIIKVVICIRNALRLYGHCEDHVRPAHPSSSASNC